MTTYPTISLCMIAKNEEDYIGQCIKSVRPIVHEIIVVDTGSTDSTISIAEGLGAKVFTTTWTNDFSLPRNLSIEKATGDWILVLDADEAIAAQDLKLLQEHTLAPQVCYEFLQRHYSNDSRLSGYLPCTGMYPDWERSYSGYFESNLCRLFPHKKGIRYIGRVHELVEHSIRKISGLSIQRSPIPIHHYGHTPEVRKKKNKGALYTPLGTEKLKDNPSYWQAWFELGVEHNNNGRLEESAAALSKAAELHPLYLPTWSNLGYVLCELKHYEKAEKVLRTALELDPNAEESWCNLGVVYLRTGKLTHAEQCFRRALQIKPEYVNAWCNLGKSLANQGRLSESVLAYRSALERMPNSPTARMDLGIIYLSRGFAKEAERYLAPLTANRDIPPHVHLLLGRAYKAMNRTTEAINALDTFCAQGVQTGIPDAELERAKVEILELSSTPMR